MAPATRTRSGVLIPDVAPLTEVEFNTLVRLARRAIRADTATKKALQERRVNVIPSNFYSEVPSVQDIETSFEFKFPDGPFNSPSVFKPEVLSDYLAVLDRYADEFHPPENGDVKAPAGYFWNNPAFGFSDAMSYYCVLRETKPEQVIEVGSGFSSLVALEALRKNGKGRLCCVEPFPMPWLAQLEGRLELIQAPVQSLEPAMFNERLKDGDVLFIDSTHTVKAGSDCLQLYLRIVPSLDASLMIHAHDVYLPFPMPRGHFDRHTYWTEQYLLYAYLLENARTCVVYGSFYNHRFNHDALERLMRGRSRSGGGSIWWRQAPPRKTI